MRLLICVKWSIHPEHAQTYCKYDLIWKKYWHTSCRRVGECLCQLKNTVFSYASAKDFINNLQTRNLELLWQRWYTWMNCAPFLELNERLKIDVTVECMCLNKGLTQQTIQYESKQNKRQCVLRCSWPAASNRDERVVDTKNKRICLGVEDFGHQPERNFGKTNSPHLGRKTAGHT